MKTNNRKKFDELNSVELSTLLGDYRTHKIETPYGWEVPFSIKDFYKNIHKGFYHDVL